MATEHAQKFKELVDGIHVAMFTTTSPEGRLVSRPMGVSAVDDDATVWFITEQHSAKAYELSREPEVNLAFQSGSTWVSLAGRASAVHDRAKVKELWSAAAEAWFPDGPDAPELVAVRVSPETAEYWDTPGGKVATALSFVKAKVTGDSLSSPDNAVIDL